MKKLLIFLCWVLVIWASGPAGAQAMEGSLADWPAIFGSDGNNVTLGGGIDAVFLQDNISAGVATDMTALDVSQGLVYNGSVPLPHDLGNGFVYATTDDLGNLILFAAVERLNSNKNTYIDFEFNQDVVGVAAGQPWPVYGLRLVNDLSVQFVFTQGNLSSVNVGVWNGSDFVTQSSAVPSQLGCFVAVPSTEFCNGTPIPGLPLANQEVWDNDFNRVQVPDPDGFIQVGINVGQLLGTNIEFSSITIRTPQDIALGSFRAMGYWSLLGKTLATQQ